MPAYSFSAFEAPYKTIARMGTQTEPNYFYGSFNHDTQSFRYQISNVALTGNVATITVQLISGGGPNALIIPQVGAVMGVQGTQTNAGAFNVDPATITAVSLNSSGFGTISYLLTHANVASTPDAGTLIVKPYEVPETLVVGASAPIALIFSPDESDTSRCLFAECAFPTLPTACTVVLQVANVDIDSRYVTVANAAGNTNLATVAGSAITQAGAQYSFIQGKFLRAKVTALTGTGSIISTVFA